MSEPLFVPSPDMLRGGVRVNSLRRWVVIVSTYDDSDTLSDPTVTDHVWYVDACGPAQACAIRSHLDTLPNAFSSSVAPYDKCELDQLIHDAENRDGIKVIMEGHYT